jgi:hypothetical protein
LSFTNSEKSKQLGKQFLRQQQEPDRICCFCKCDTIAGNIIAAKQRSFFGKLTFNTKLWKEMMLYAMPLIIVGLGGIINETFDRIFLKYGSPAQRRKDWCN